MPPPPSDYSFTPSEYRLLSFLRLKIAGEPLPATAAAHFHDADIYTADPSQLTTLFDPAPARKGESGSWFFFTHVRPKSSSDSRKSRQVAGGVGTWHSECAPRRVLDDEGNCAGYSQYFSYKLKIGKKCSERTEWYMVEFSDDQEGDHERVRGGEPQLVLSKIYKAHTHSRSGNTSASRPSCSASARKRKAVDEASAPPAVKAKRRLFDSPAPAPAARSQEQVRTTTQSNLMRLFDSPALASVLKSQGQVRPTTQSNLMQLFDSPALASVLKSQGQVRPTTQSNLMRLFDSPASASAARSQEQVMSTTQSILHSSSPVTSKGKIGDTSDCIALMSKADGEATTSQLKIGDTSDFSRFWPEPEATFDWGYKTTGGTLPTLDNCSSTNVRDVGDVFCGRDAWPSAFHTNNDIDTTAFVCGMPSAPFLPTLENGSRTNVRDVSDVFCGRDAWPSAFHTSNDTTAFVCGMPSAPVLLPPREASWWCVR